MSIDPTIEAILRCWKRQGEYLTSLLADVPDSELVRQPVPGVTMTHPAWVLAHLSPYPSVMTAFITGGSYEDPKSNRWWMGSTPSPRREDYAQRDRLLGGYLADRDALTRALEKADSSNLRAKTPLARWQGSYPLVIDVLCHLMLEHECTHIGQISAWRRACGRPPVG